MSIVKLSALSAEAREVLALAPNDWRRMPMRHASIATDLERYGLVETETSWQWSTRNSGAGRHVVMWRKLPATPSGVE